MRRRLSKLLPRRRWQRVLLILLPLAALAWFAIPQLFVPRIRAKLQGMIAGHLDARLQIGRLMYAPPFGVRARDVTLVSNATLPGWQGDVALLRVEKLDLKLARLPFKPGPLVIQNITVSNPEVHLIRTEDGRLIGMHSFLKEQPPEAQTQPTAPPPPAATRPASQPGDGEGDHAPDKVDPEAAKAKLSDMFELRHFGIRSGKVVYEDRSSPGLPPVVWKDLDVGMETRPQSRSVYGYTFDARNGDLAKLNSTGSFDLDTLVVQLGNLHVDAKTVYTDEQSPLPAQVQRVLRDYRVRGRVRFDAGGTFPVRDPGASTYKATVELRDGSGYSPQWDATLDRLSVKLSTEKTSAGGAKAGEMLVRLEALDAASGDTTFRIDKAEALLDRYAGTWSLAEVAARLDLGGEPGALPKQSRPILAGTGARGRVDFTLAASGLLRPRDGEHFLLPEDIAFLAYPRGVSLTPSKSPAPMTDIGGGGSVRKDRGSRVVSFDNITFNYGTDPIVLASARLPLPRDFGQLKKQTRVEEISGTIDFRRPGPRYPGGFGKVVAALRPVGPFVVGRDSWYSVTAVDPPLRVRGEPGAPPRIPPPRKSDYFFSVATDGGSFTLTEKRIELLNMTGDATVSNMLIDVRRLEADVLGGRLSGTMKVTPGGVTRYNGVAFLRGVDLEALSRRLILPETRQGRLSGVGNLDVQFAVENRRGQGESVLDHTRAAGEFEVLRGDFWTIPVLGDIAGRVPDRRKERGEPRDSLGTIGEAAGLFEIRDGTLVLRNAAVSSPALGVVGSGTIGLTGEKKLDLRIVAAPLGDWRAKVRETNVPVLSDVAGEVFGALQRVVNTATSTLLYEFRVTGTMKDRQVQTVPVPALTEPAAVLFGRMLRGDDERKLLETMRGKRAGPADAKPAANAADKSAR